MYINVVRVVCTADLSSPAAVTEGFVIDRTPRPVAEGQEEVDSGQEQADSGEEADSGQEEADGGQEEADDGQEEADGMFGAGPPPAKRARNTKTVKAPKGPPMEKNPLMALNELKPG
jgi:hypothetical protein